MWNMSGALLKGSLLHPRPYIQKMHCILQVDGRKEANILKSFMSVNSEFPWKNIRNVYHTEVKFLESILVFFALSNQKPMHNNYRPKYLYFCLLSFSKYDILYRTLSTLSAKAFKSLSVGHLIPGLKG